jgi:hypothetical protein
MAGRQSGDLIALDRKKGRGTDQERADPLPGKDCKSLFNFARRACIRDRQTHPEDARRSLCFPHFGLGTGTGRIDQKTNRCGRRQDFAQQIKTLG